MNKGEKYKPVPSLPEDQDDKVDEILLNIKKFNKQKN